MNIVVLFGSPNVNGSTKLLAESFKKGAEESGNRVEILDITKMNISTCGGCVACGYEGPCVKKDDMIVVKQKLLNADMVVFATPLYYYGMSAQLKSVVDRFCFFNSSLTKKHLKSLLLTVAWNSDDWTFNALTAHYRTIARYLGFDDMGMILGYGCGTPYITSNSKYIIIAYEFGKKLK